MTLFATQCPHGLMTDDCFMCKPEPVPAMTTDLVSRLRAVSMYPETGPYTSVLMGDAADRIAELERALRECVQPLADRCKYWDKAVAEAHETDDEGYILQNERKRGEEQARLGRVQAALSGTVPRADGLVEALDLFRYAAAWRASDDWDSGPEETAAFKHAKAQADAALGALTPERIAEIGNRVRPYLEGAALAAHKGGRT